MASCGSEGELLLTEQVRPLIPGLELGDLALPEAEVVMEVLELLAQIR
jgi:hypothetical protein